MRLSRRVLILVGVLVLLGACTPTESGGSSTSESAEPSTTSSIQQVTTTTPTSTVQKTTTTVAEWEEDEAESALTAVDDFYAALNAGDVEAALRLVVDATPEARMTEKYPIAVNGLNAQFEYECTLSSPGTVECVEYVSDDLYGPAGITNSATFSFAYRSGNLAYSHYPWPFVCEFDPTGDALTFLMEFRVWSAENHPELEPYWYWGWPIDSPAAIPCTVYPFTSAENATTVCELVPEFIAQSAKWPVDSA